MKPTLVRRLVLSAATVGAVWLTVAVGFDLAGYGVPLPFLGALCLACLVVFLNAVCEADKSWSTTTHRCTACSFTVRLTRATPGESRRWQEIAAAHPDHTA